MALEIRMRAFSYLFAAAAAVSLSSVSIAAAPVDPSIINEFAKPHQLVRLEDGRRINLFCMGSGDRTVLFDAGGSDWSVVWALVQPVIASKAKACSYDRAGLGYSDSSPAPRTPVSIVDDAHALISTALKGPVILVGHSLGGFHAKLHAALYPNDVEGLVLVDPAEDRWWDRTRAATRKKYGARLAARSELLDESFFARLEARYRDCVTAARTADLDPKSTAYRRCSDPPRPQLGAEIATERARLQVKATYQEAQASEIANSVYAGKGGDEAYSDLFKPGAVGSKPVIVLTHGRYDANDPVDSLGQFQSLALHRQTAALSSKGVQRVVPDTGHYIELDAPDAVISAIEEVLSAVDRAARPTRARSASAGR
jgi:pimeloyl-ACP methyl ester carboxylesterase